MNPLEFNLNEYYMTPADACRYLDLEPHQIRALAFAKKIGYQMVGGRSLLFKADVEALKAKGSVTVPQEQDPILERKRLEATHLKAANGQF